MNRFSQNLRVIFRVKCSIVGSYGWGDGEWMREWEKRVTDAGAKLANESVIANDSPDEDAVTACNGLGKIVAAL